MTLLWYAFLVYAALVVALTYGPFREVYWLPMARLLERIGMAAITIGRFCFARERAYLPLGEQARKHERCHHWQWMVLFVLFPPVYLILLKIYGYDKHPLEQDARRAAGQPLR